MKALYLKENTGIENKWYEVEKEDATHYMVDIGRKFGILKASCVTDEKPIADQISERITTDWVNQRGEPGNRTGISIINQVKKAEAEKQNDDKTIATYQWRLRQQVAKFA